MGPGSPSLGARPIREAQSSRKQLNCVLDNAPRQARRVANERTVGPANSVFVRQHRAPERQSRVDKAQRRQHYEELLAEAKKSPKDEFTGRVRCLSCGKALDGYPQLAQHLHSRHYGVNSPDARFIEYERRKSQGKKAPLPSRVAFTVGDLFAAAFDSIELKRRTRTEQQAVMRPGNGVGRGRVNLQKQRPLSKKHEQTAQARVTNSLKYANARGRQGTNGGTVKHVGEGEKMLDREEVRRLEAAVGLRLRRTKNVSRAIRKRTTVRKIRVLTARVAAARRLLHTLQKDLDEQEKALDEFVNDGEQGNDAPAGHDDGALNRVKLDMQVSALRLAVEEAQKMLCSTTAKWHEKLPVKRVLFEELFMSQHTPQFQTGGSNSPPAESPVGEMTCSDELFEAYKELDSHTPRLDGIDEHPPDLLSCCESPVASSSKIPSAQTKTEQQPQGFSEHEKLNAATGVGFIGECQSSRAGSEGSDTLDALSCWAKAAGVQKLYLQVGKPEACAESHGELQSNIRNGSHEPLPEVTCNATVSCGNKLNVACGSSATEGSSFSRHKVQETQDRCSPLCELDLESSDDGSLDLGFCDVLSSWAAANHTSKVCKSMETGVGRSNSNCQATGGIHNSESKGCPNPCSLADMTDCYRVCEVESPDEDDNESFGFCDVLSSWASSTKPPNLAKVSSTQVENFATSVTVSQKLAPTTANERRVSAGMPFSGEKAKVNWIRVLNRSEMSDRRQVSSVSRECIQQPSERPQGPSPSGVLAGPTLKGSHVSSLYDSGEKLLVTSVPCAFSRARDDVEREDDENSRVSCRNEPDKGASSSATKANHNISQFGSVESDTCFAPAPASLEGPNGVLDDHNGTLIGGSKCRMLDGRKRKRKKKRIGTTGIPNLPPGGVESVTQQGAVPNHSQCDMSCEQCQVVCSTREDFLSHIRSRKHLQRASRAILHEKERIAMEGSNPVKDSLTAPEADAQLPTSKPMHSKAVDEAVQVLLSRLSELQKNSLLQHVNEKHKAHRWLTNGMREVQQAIKHRRVKAVIAAPNIEHPLDHTLDQLVQLAVSEGIPVIYALSRRKLGAVFHFRKKMSVVAILDWQGAKQEFDKLLEEAQNAAGETKLAC